MVSSDDQVEVREAEATKTAADALMIVVPMLMFGAVMFALAYAMYAPSAENRQHVAQLEADAKAYQNVKTSTAQASTCTVMETTLSVKTYDDKQPVYGNATANTSGSNTYTLVYTQTGEKHVLMTQVVEEQTLKCRSVVRETAQEVK